MDELADEEEMSMELSGEFSYECSRIVQQFRCFFMKKNAYCDSLTRSIIIGL